MRLPAALASAPSRGPPLALCQDRVFTSSRCPVGTSTSWRR